MKIWTYGELLTQVQQELDLQNEVNILPDEYVEYHNEAVHQAESEILTLYEDYFLTSASLTMTQGSADVTPPAGMYAAKIRSLIYINGAIIYPVKRVRGPNKFEMIERQNAFSNLEDYQYWVNNASIAAGFKIQLTPFARESGSYLRAYFIRNAVRIPLVSAGSQSASNATQVDLPEFYTFIKQYMKVRCLEKDGADLRLPGAVAILEKERELMTSTLASMQPDEDNTLQPDFSHYWEHE